MERIRQQVAQKSKKKDMIDSRLNQWEYVSGKEGRGMKAKHNFLQD